MQALIDFIIRNLVAIQPWCRIDAWNTAVRVRWGILKEELTPGFHWRIPFIDEIRTYPRTECVADLKTAAITTKDGESVVVSGNVGFRCLSIRQMWETVWSADDSLRQLALGRLASECANREWSELHGEGRARLEAELRDAVNASVAQWGVEVTRVHLTDCVKSRQSRLFVDGLPYR